MIPHPIGRMLIGVALLTSGCCDSRGVPSECRKAAEMLQAAIEAENFRWLDGDAKWIERLKSDGKLSDAEYRSLRRILDKAKEGDWKTARELNSKLRD
ncbi:MAG: hypothetical protein JOZ53_12165 [Planctomycetaceae bacterium]|nr:hypothetical protein [Planctomycetaceae bacterium]